MAAQSVKSAMGHRLIAFSIPRKYNGMNLLGNIISVFLAHSIFKMREGCGTIEKSFE